MTTTQNDSLVTMTLCDSQVLLLPISRLSGVFTTAEAFEAADKDANLQYIVMLILRK